MSVILMYDEIKTFHFCNTDESSQEQTPSPKLYSCRPLHNCTF